MEDPKITWFVKNTSGNFVADDTYYAGSYVQGTKPLSATIRIWNNRCGTTNVQDLKNLSLILYFSNMEDSSLLPYLSVSTKDEAGTVVITNNRAAVTFVNPVTLSGKANNGDEKKYESNFIDITISFDVTTTEQRLKTHDIKNLYIEVGDL